jgi:hypothetical protein
MRLLVLMPLYKVMDVNCVISLVSFVSELNNDGHTVRVSFCNGFNAAKARKILTLDAVKKVDEYDYAVWLDSDHFYKTKDLYALINSMMLDDLPMLSGSYKLHSGDETAHGSMVDGKFKHFKDSELGDKPFECDVIGFGFLVMTGQFIKYMWESFGENLFILDAQSSMTEDVQFCRCAKEKGYKICFHPKVKIGHVESVIRY